MTTNSIMLDATSGPPQLAAGTDVYGAGVDLHALVAYFRANPALTPPPIRAFPK